jgi:F420-dependent oxidoreductase-like protein
MAIPFGMFVPQGWRMDLVEIDDPIEQYEAMTRVALVAEESGFDSAWVYDHFHTVPTPEIETCFEAWTITAGLVRDTKRIKIGQMVTCNGYRHPALLAKMASTVDVMSHGRLFFGLGAGWYEHEWRAYYGNYPDTPDRMRAFREACQIIHGMWTEERPKFEGKYYTINEPINEPKGVQTPYPSFWIGGGGEKVTLKLVAQYGNACNVGGDVETIKHKFDVLRQHCDDLGRNYDDIIRSTSINVHLVGVTDDPESATSQARGSRSYAEYSQSFWVGTSDQIVERLQPLIDAGVNYVLVYMPRVAVDPEPVRVFAQEVMTKFQ